MTTARRTALMRKAGPYKVTSCADGSLIVEPGWPEYPPAVERAIHGGGPGPFTRMGLAADLEAWLNVPFKGDA